MNGQRVSIQFGGPMTPVVKNLLIANGAIFIIQLIVELISPGFIVNNFAVSYTGVFHEFKLWQVFTYMFIHGGIFHIFFNLLMLWMFGGELEQLWGSRLFIKYYFICGIGAAFFIILLSFISYSRYSQVNATLGASGAIYGILIAYAMTWPNRQVLLFFVIPVKIKYLMVFVIFVSLALTLQSAGGRTESMVSHVGHLGGLITGLLFILLRIRPYTERYINKTIKGTKGPIKDAVKKARVNKKKKVIETRIKAKKIIDELLEKIAREGMSSLSSKEKKQLEWARKHYYPEDRDTLH
jgi:membrane associated rhomboid family serine protease